MSSMRNANVFVIMALTACTNLTVGLGIAANDRRQLYCRDQRDETNVCFRKGVSSASVGGSLVDSILSDWSIG